MVPGRRAGAAVRRGGRAVDDRLRRSCRWSVRHLVRCATIDTRTLAVFRMAAGVLVLADLLSRSRNFSFYYTDDGVVTRELALEVGRGSPPFSLFHFTTDPALIAGLFVVHGLVAVLLIVGFRSRIMLALTFLFVISLDQHNPLVTSYADVLFRFLLLWALFLPVGERWSIDAVQRGREPRGTVASFFSAVLLLQMVVMYVVNGYHKRQSDLWRPSLVPNWEGGFRFDPHWPGGEATPLIMGLDEMTFLLGDTVREVPPIVLQLGGITWYYMLLTGWLLFLLVGRLRYPLVAMFVGGHATFALTVRIGAFPYVAMLGLLPFLQSTFWRDATAVLAYLGPLDRAVWHAHGRLDTGGRQLAALAPAPVIGSGLGRDVRDALFEATSGVVAVSMVFLLVFSLLAMGYGGGHVSVPAEAVEGGPATDGEWNLQPAASVSQPGWDVYAPNPVPVGAMAAGETLRSEIWGIKDSFAVAQPSWSIFAPTPRTTDRYYVFPAVTEDGEKLDVFNERRLTFDRPGQELQRQHDAYRERFYMNSIRRQAGDGLANELLAEYICETWPEEHGETLTHVNMYQVTERVTMETISSPEERPQNIRAISYHTCGDHEPREIVPPDE